MPDKPPKDAPEKARRAQPPLGQDPPSEKVLDTAIEYTFPASDPPAIQESYEHARKREEARRKPPKGKRP
jgi:hypothetical protein